MVKLRDQGTSVRQCIPYVLDASVTQVSSASGNARFFPWLSELKVIVQFKFVLDTYS